MHGRIWPKKSVNRVESCFSNGCTSLLRYSVHGTVVQVMHVQFLSTGKHHSDLTCNYQICILQAIFLIVEIVTKYGKILLSFLIHKKCHSLENGKHCLILLGYFLWPFLHRGSFSKNSFLWFSHSQMTTILKYLAFSQDAALYMMATVAQTRGQSPP